MKNPIEPERQRKAVLFIFIILLLVLSAVGTMYGYDVRTVLPTLNSIVRELH